VRRCAVAAALALAACGTDAAPAGVARSRAELFGERVIPRFELELDDAARASLAAHPKEWVRATFRYAGVTYADVGVRWKGNRSRQGLRGKPSWKIRFDKFVKKRRFLGVKELVLNNLVEDPTAVREALGYRLHRDLGVAAPRTGWAQLVVDGQDFGMYLDLEAIGGDLLERAYGDDDGTLYEGEFGCDLYPDDAPRFEQDGGDDQGHADLIALATLAEREPARLWASDGPLDRARVAAFLAVSAVIGDFDGYRHAHNYRLHHDRATDRWSLQPWGLDRTFRQHLALTDSGGRLATLCFADAGCRADYAAAVARAADRLEALVADRTLDRWFVMVDAAGRADPRRPADAAEVKQARAALRRFVRDRPAEVRAQLPCLGAAPPASCPTAPPVACDPLAIGDATFELCAPALTWPDAEAACVARGRHLARVDDEAQALALAAAAKTRGKDRYWIGLSDRGAEGAWAWADGQPATFTRFGKGQPDDFACGEDCVGLRPKDGAWGDAHCMQRRPFICR